MRRHLPWILFLAPAPAVAAEPEPSADLRARAVRRTASISIDGHLDDEGWKEAPVTTGFVQRSPREGAKAIDETEFRVAYDDKAVYVAIRCHDDHPDEIRGLLTRRDAISTSDWVLVGLDSYHDRRTAFFFAVNAAGVQRDFLIFNDGEQDDSWDAVWSAATDVDDQGWAVEIRIPLSQIRFSAAEEQSWGLQVIRRKATSGEETTWSPWSRSSGKVVSEFGVLESIRGLKPGRRIEILPYITGGVGLAADDPMNPFDATADGLFNAGIDLKYGLSSAFTLAATINPDFGQVEADPSQVNLSGQQIFFPEKRPFFLEGKELLHYSLQQGNGNNTFGEGLFYTRRIGAPPRLHGNDYASYSDTPDATVIYGAAKVTGKTSSGWSIGALEAVTGQEKAALSDDLPDLVVEPLTNYAMVRTRKDLRGGATTISGAVTAVNRKLDTPEVTAALHDQAYTGGVDVSHRFWNEQWGTSWKLYGSWVHGSKEAIALDQTDIRRLYQRPDRKGVSFDPDRTSLLGAGAQWDVGRWSHKRVNFGVGGRYFSPGIEVNDMGFSNSADQHLNWFWMGIRQDEPTEQILSWSTDFNLWAFGNFEPLLQGYGTDIGGNIQLESYWNLGGGFSLEDGRWNTTALRGGPRLHAQNSGGLWGNITTDTRKKVWGTFSGNLWRRPESDSWNAGANANITLQARSNLDLTLGPNFFVVYEDYQYLDTVQDSMDRTTYVFGRMHEIVTALTVRASYTYSPSLSIQFYAQPFIAAGLFEEYKEAADTYSDDYGERFDIYDPRNITDDGETISIDRDGDGANDVVIGKPDFDFREVRSNLVARWEYRPGSTLFFIWAHNATSDEVTGNFRLGHDLSALARERGEDVVMVKLNYWVGL